MPSTCPCPSSRLCSPGKTWLLGIFLILHTSALPPSPLPQVVVHPWRDNYKACEVRKIIANTLEVVFFEGSGTVYPLLTYSQTLLRSNSNRRPSHTIGGLGWYKGRSALAFSGTIQDIEGLHIISGECGMTYTRQMNNGMHGCRLHILWNQPPWNNLAQGTEVLTIREVGFRSEAGELYGEAGRATAIVLEGEEGRTRVVVLDDVDVMETYKRLNTSHMKNSCLEPTPVNHYQIRSMTSMK
jgi:hypothetical protein